MKANKGNKVYSITEAEKESYKKQGYDITEDDGKVIENGIGKSVPYEKYKELEDDHIGLLNAYKKSEEKYAELQKENEGLRISNMTVDQLKAYATDKKFDLGDATTRDAILDKIKIALGIVVEATETNTAAQAPTK